MIFRQQAKREMFLTRLGYFPFFSHNIEFGTQTSACMADCALQTSLTSLSGRPLRGSVASRGAGRSAGPENWSCKMRRRYCCVLCGVSLIAPKWKDSFIWSDIAGRHLENVDFTAEMNGFACRCPWMQGWIHPWRFLFNAYLWALSWACRCWLTQNDIQCYTDWFRPKPRVNLLIFNQFIAVISQFPLIAPTFSFSIPSFFCLLLFILSFFFPFCPVLLSLILF